MNSKSFGFPISSHPLEPYLETINKWIKKAKDIPKYVGKSIYLAGVYITRKETQTHAREAMEFLTLEDETDIYECVLFPESFVNMVIYCIGKNYFFSVAQLKKPLGYIRSRLKNWLAYHKVLIKLNESQLN